MSRYITMKNREMWAQYNKLLWDALHALNGVDYKTQQQLLLHQVKDAGWTEYHEIERFLSPMNEMWENIDFSVIKVGDCYKCFTGKADDWDAKTEYYKVLDIKPHDVVLKRFTVHKSSVYTNSFSDHDRLNKRWFALQIIDGFMHKVSEEEYNDIESLNEKLNTIYHASRQHTDNAE